MSNQGKVAARSRPTSIHLSDDDRAVAEEYAELRYDGLVGFTTVIKQEAMASIRKKLARLKADRTTTPNQNADQ